MYSIVHMLSIFWTFALLSSGIVANKIVLAYVPPVFSVALRMLIAGSILLAYAFHQNVRFMSKYLRRDMIMLGIAALLTTLVPAILKAYALKNLISSKAAFLGSLDPFVTALYAYLFWKEKLNWQKALGIFVGFSGAMVLLVSSVPTDSNNLMAWSVFSYPELAALCAMAIGRLGWMIVQKLIRTNRYSASEMSGTSMTFSGCMAMILSVSSEIPSTLCFTKPIVFFGALFWTAIIGNVLTYTRYTNLLKHYSSTFISLTGFSVPIFVYFYGWLLLGEPLSLNFVISVAITLVGLIIFYSAEMKQKTFLAYKE